MPRPKYIYIALDGGIKYVTSRKVDMKGWLETNPADYVMRVIDSRQGNYHTFSVSEFNDL